ncbi:PREDICTED: methyltransferase-like protein 7A isoform X2 [Tarenaya hassleriana]|uniref:methyltransferase-like protein 7A isoform X2 n=1 Tax=Tarenaya hassleriana TaxID=28532 RepID=UPI00053C6BE5|nr:PREDICTED: methyltransferase-like protein 7A isoform X2 [Tarenaya hassleriana]
MNISFVSVIVELKTLMTSLHSSPISSIGYLPRRSIRASRHHRVLVEAQKIHVPTEDDGSCRFCSCGRRRFLRAAATTPFLPLHPLDASASTADGFKRIHPPRPGWYEELSAWSMNTGMQSYEAEIAGYKMKLFDNLVGKAEQVLEIGIGTGPNLKYYASIPNVSVLGLDPNAKMEKYARKSAAEAGLKPEDFRFIRAVGEAMPLGDASIDAVIGTLVLCSVSDVARTLEEIKRVLRPGGVYLFIEHVAAEDGSALRFVQNVLDPLQEIVADGCHLTRRTGDSISEAGFSGGAEINKVSLSSVSYISSHVYGIAYN